MIYHGTSGADTFEGSLHWPGDPSSGADTMIGYAGDDTYHVDHSGDSVVEAAGEGNDTVISHLYSYTLAANVENLIYGGSSGGGNLHGNELDNRLEGGAGWDHLSGGAGSDTMIGHLGSDSYHVQDLGDVVIEVAGEGNDTIYSDLTYYALGANMEGLRYSGTTGSFRGIGNELDNSIHGGKGDDWLDGGSGSDEMLGGLGNDTFIVDSFGDVVGEYINWGTDTVMTSLTSYTLGANFENLVFNGDSSAMFYATGNELGNYIEGGDADDSLSGLGGNDTLDGRGGSDQMYGDAGDDIYIIDNTGDQVTEYIAGGIDTVQSSISYILDAHLENLALTGSDTVNGNGNGLDNILIGNTAANILDGGNGADTLSGGFGNDTYYVDEVGDQVTEAGSSGGYDQVVSLVSFSASSQYIEKITLTGTAATNARGNGLANVLNGNGAANVLNGLSGADSMYGGLGNDTYYVDNVGDKAVETSSSGGTDLVISSVTFALVANVERLTLAASGDINGYGNALGNILTGNAGANRLDGGAGNDLLSAGGGSDRLNGGSEADKLYGGAGNDVLSGGAGLDYFYFDTALSASANVDTISDFVRVDDTIFLDRSIFSGIAATGTVSASAFQGGTAAVDADDRILYDQASGKIFYDADGLGGTAAVLFAQVTAGTVLTNADFIAVA